MSRLEQARLRVDLDVDAPGLEARTSAIAVSGRLHQSFYTGRVTEENARVHQARRPARDGEPRTGRHQGSAVGWSDLAPHRIQALARAGDGGELGLHLAELLALGLAPP